MNADDIDRFAGLLTASLDAGSFVKLVLSKHHGEPADLLRSDARVIVLRGARQLSFTDHHQTRDVTRNLPLADVAAATAAVRGRLGVGAFRHAHLTTATQRVELLIGKRGSAHLRVSAGEADAAPAAVPLGASHDRAKQRAVDPTRPFLTALGVTTASHDVVPAMARKWKQINRFVEVFAAALQASPLATAGSSTSELEAVHVVDFGSGKGYLTFAVHDFLAHGQGRAVDVVGVELRPDMVELGNAVAARLALNGLRFEQGDIRDFKPLQLDVMIALHACDTATDLAIHLGIRAGAAIVMCSPCCHKEVRPQLLSPHPIRAILQHGVHLGQEAEMVTDGLRALLLDACGYDTQVFEFVALEHTSKNKMILAVKRVQPRPPDDALAQVAEVKRFYGIREQMLETLLRDDGRLG